MILKHYTESNYKKSRSSIIYVGSSNENKKIIKLNDNYRNPIFYPRKFENDPDKFLVELLDGQICVTRIDTNLGWGGNLIIDVEYENEQSLGNSVNQKIPRVIYQTFKSYDVPKGMYDAVNSWIDTNPDYEHYFFNDEDNISFIEKYFDKSVLDAYLDLVPGAFRADLWRCCVLYEKGGVYVDSDMICLKPLNKIIESDDDFLIARDDPMSKKFLYNGFMAATPKHPFFLEQINRIVKNVQVKKNGYYLDISGPALLGKSVNKILERDEESEYVIGKQKINDFSFKVFEHDWLTRTIKTDNDSIILTEYPNKNYEMDFLKIPTYYSLYQKNVIYREIPRNIYYTTRDYLGINNYMVSSFTQKNKFWKLNYFNDDDCFSFFRKHNEELKSLLGVDTLQYYLSLENGGEKSDFWRYCIIYLFGGFYTDADTYCNLTLDNWIRNYDLVLGIEANLPYEFAKSFGMHIIGQQIGDSVVSVCNWSFGAKPKHDFFKNLIVDICTNPIRDNVLLNTGPGRITRHAMNYFGRDNFGELNKDNLYKDKSVLFNINKFGSNQSHSNAYKNYENPFDVHGVDDVYIIHNFEGSWRNTSNKDIKIIPSDYKIVTNLTISDTDNGYKGVARLDIDYNRTQFMVNIADCRSLLEINFDKNFNVISESEKFITNIDKKTKFEDSRFFDFKGKKYLVTSYIDEDFNVKVSILDENYKYLGDVNIDEYNHVSFLGREVIWEKNWLFFEKDNDLFFIYSTTPKFVIYRCSDFEKLIFEKYIDIDWPLKDNVPDNEIYFTGYIGCNRKVATAGSTAPIYIKEKDVYLYLIHTKFYGERKYNHYAVILDRNLNPIKLVTEPIITKHVPYQHMFVSSMIDNNDYFIISGGISDTINFVWELSKTQIIKLLKLN
jgi:mannosyltransferase OCH1-like enzyme